MRLFAMLLTLMVALAGCSSDDGSEAADPTETQTATETQAPTSTQTATGTTGPTPDPEVNETTPNTPPTATLAASVEQGEAPVRVGFDIDATDADGDDLEWELDADEDGEGDIFGSGTDLPLTIFFNYTEAGTYNATFTVSDGTNSTVAQTLITITEAAPSAPVFEPVHMEQDILLSCPHCVGSDVTAAATCVGFAAGEQGLDCWWFEVDASWIGRTLTIGGGFMMAIEFETSCDGSGTVVGSYLSNEETIPEGAGCVIVLDIVDPVITATADIA